MEMTKVKHVSLQATVEKLDGGFISNITGKRKIYKDSHDIDEAINISDIFNNMEDEEYNLQITLVPSNESMATIHFSPMVEEDVIDDYPVDEPVEEGEKLSLYEQAKRDGIIQPAEDYNPLPAVTEVVEDHSNIVVTKATAYSISKLKGIDWMKYDDEVPLTYGEKAAIAGIKPASMYTLWTAVSTGKAQFQRPETRIAITILAKYYEAKLGVGCNIKQQLDNIKTDLLAQLRELEVLNSKGPYTKATAVATAIGKMRKLLIQ